MQSCPLPARCRSRLSDIQPLCIFLCMFFGAQAPAQAVRPLKHSADRRHAVNPGSPSTLISSLSAADFPDAHGQGSGRIKVEQTTSTARITAPLVASDNPHYFKDASGAAIILTGSQTWNTLQDWGSDGTLETLDFDAYVRFLTANGHNFTLLWRTEMPKFCGFPSMQGSAPELTVGPHPWRRTGPGNATDGGLKFDLSKFDQSYFDRLRRRTAALHEAGIYAGIYLFTGEWLNIFRCPSDGYPFHRSQQY